jgi:hypothetical protein
LNFKRKSRARFILGRHPLALPQITSGIRTEYGGRTSAESTRSLEVWHRVRQIRWSISLGVGRRGCRISQAPCQRVAVLAPRVADVVRGNRVEKETSDQSHAAGNPKKSDPSISLNAMPLKGETRSRNETSLNLLLGSKWPRAKIFIVRGMVIKMLYRNANGPRHPRPKGLKNGVQWYTDVIKTEIS